MKLPENGDMGTKKRIKGKERRGESRGGEGAEREERGEGRKGVSILHHTQKLATQK